MTDTPKQIALNSLRQEYRMLKELVEAQYDLKDIMDKTEAKIKQLEEQP